VKGQYDYVGALENMVPHGHGVMTLPNGQIWEGQFQHGTPVGVGELTEDGKTVPGRWRQGRFVRASS